MHPELKGLYVITDAVLTPDETVVDQIRQALEAGAGVVQYREKHKSDAEVEPVCRELQTLCTRYNAPFIIDDRVDLAVKIGADGLHVGKDDTDVPTARQRFGGILGVSCYGSVRKALEAQEQGADYVAFGSVYASPTKPRSGVISHSVFAKARETISLPVCAIGGINVTNIHEIAALGPEMLCVVSAAFDGEIRRNVTQLLQGMKV